MKRRSIDFHCGADVIADINRLREGGYAKTKNWNLTQVCEHLTATMKGGMEGFGFRLPWIMRATFVKWVFNHALKTRKLLSGAPTFKSLKPSMELGADDNGVIDECIKTIEQAETFDGSLEDYALLDNLTADKWRQFMWIHAAHHLSFLVPNVEGE